MITVLYHADGGKRDVVRYRCLGVVFVSRVGFIFCSGSSSMLWDKTEGVVQSGCGGIDFMLWDKIQAVDQNPCCGAKFMLWN